MGRIVKRKYEIDTGGKLKMTAAFVSDIHEREPSELIRMLSKISPEVIFIGGDLIEAKTPRKLQNNEGSYNSFEFLKEAVAIAPVYYGLGNHEAYLSKEKKRRAIECGAHLLENKHALVKLHGGTFIIGAIATSIDEAWLSRFEDHDEYKILICHEPDRYVNELSDVKADLVLSGHAHGGQWRFLGRGVYAPGQGLFPKYTRGIYGKMLVSAGAANHTPIPRFFNPTEVVEIKFI